MKDSGIYTGEVIHQRFAPKPHRLSYHIFQILFDLDHPVETRFLSSNRFNLFGFYDRDHGPDHDRPTPHRRLPFKGNLSHMNIHSALNEVPSR